MLLYMQAPSEAPVCEEYQTGGPPLTSQQVCLPRSLSLYVCVYLYLIWCLKRPKLVTLFPPKVHVYLLTLAYIYIYIMQPDSEQVVQEEHPNRITFSEAPRPVITYSRTVSRNVILVLEFEQMYIEFLMVGKLTYKFWFFCSLH